MSIAEERPIEARVHDVRCSRDRLHVALEDGREISVPLRWYPRLEGATAPQRDHWLIAGSGYGIHWPDIDDDLSVEGLLAGRAAPGVVK